ncbi:MAG: serine hydrolase domain-containing protein, partial [Bacteroidota bacterium]
GMIRYFTICLCLLTYFTGLRGQDPVVSQADLDAIFAPFDQADQPGVAVSLRYRGQVVYERAFGLANLETGEKLSPDTPMALEQLSGQFTAFALLQLAAEGSLALTDPVNKHLPELANFGHQVTLLHLLARTHGFHDIGNVRVVQGARPGQTIDIDRILGILSRQRTPAFKPGTKFSDTPSDSGLWLMAEIVSRISGKPFAEFCAEKIFQPLGMKNSFFITPNEDLPANTAIAYREGENGFTRALPNNHAPGPFGLYSSVADWSRWQNHLANPPSAFAAAMARLDEVVTLDDGHPYHFTRGELTLGQQYHHSERGVPEIYGMGGRGGYTSSVFRFEDHGFSVVVLGNNGMPYTGYLGMNSTYLFLENDFPKPAVVTVAPEDVYPLSGAELASFAGHYWDADGTLVRRVTYARDTLFYNRGNTPQPLIPIGPRRFQLITGWDDELIITFPAGEDGTQRMEYASPESDPYVFEKYLPIDSSEVAFPDYLGSYYCQDLSVGYDLSHTEGQLTLSNAYAKSISLTPRLLDRFYGDQVPWWNLEFTRNAQGEVLGFHLNIGGLRNAWFQRLEIGPGN